MEIAKIKVNGVSARTVSSEEIPAGIIGAEVLFTYDTMWDGLMKTVVFRGCCTVDVLNAGSSVRIPTEVVAKAGVRVFVGVYGVDSDDNVAIPTLWASLGVTKSATDPSGDVSTDPQLPVWAQLEGRIKALENSPNGEVDPNVVQGYVEDYLQENPPSNGQPGADGVGITNITIEEV